ncbi:MAG: hypothetical protein IKY59_06260 [Oscillospiraceae bacterium]|nr:hypothetical protein [Oscillospiraceae bacterium]
MMKYEKPAAEVVNFASLDRIARTDVDLGVNLPGIDIGGAGNVSGGVSDKRD